MYVIICHIMKKCPSYIFSCLLVFLHRTKQVTNNKERVMQRLVQTGQEWVLYKPNIEHTLYFDLLFRKENRVLVCPHLKYFGKVLLCHVFHSEHHSNYPKMHNTSKRKWRLISVLFCLNTTFPYQMIRCVFEANNGKKINSILQYLADIEMFCSFVCYGVFFFVPLKWTNMWHVERKCPWEYS